jgi:hypothetical protein
VRPIQACHDFPVSEDDIIQFVSSLPGVAAMTASESNGAPEAAWGDSFFFYDPAGDTPADRRFPFVTLVTQDYDGFDMASNLNRPGVFRVNIAAGRDAYTELFGHSPADHASHHESYDYSAADQLIPHPVYAVQGWISIVNPDERTAAQLRSLVTEAHARAAARHDRRH